MVGHARDRGDTVLEFDGGSTRVTFRDLHRRALTFAHGLATAVPPKQPVLVMVRSDVASVVAICACLQLGVPCVPVPVPSRGGSTERIRSVLATSGASAIVAPQDAGHLRTQWPEFVWLTVDAEACSASSAMLPAPPTSSIAIVQYTSGSTSEPRGVALTHGNIVSNLEMLRKALSIREDDHFLSWLPLFHDMGLAMLLMPLHFGVPGTFLLPLSFVRDPIRWLRTASKCAATVIGAPDFAFETCLRRATDTDISALDLSRCRVAFCGAEPVKLSTMAGFADRFASTGFRSSALYACYGLAEAVCFVAGGFVAPQGTFPKDVEAGWSLPCGAAAEKSLVAIVDADTGMPLEDGENGEIWVHGDHVALGYWNNPDASRAAFGAMLDGLPYLRTGDLGFLCAGVLTVSGRLKDVMIHRGVNIHAVDLETTVARSHPAFGHVGAAFATVFEGTERIVVVHEAARLSTGHDPRAMVEAALDAVAMQHAVRLFDMLIVRAHSLPRTTSGKIRRSLCRSLYRDGSYDGGHVLFKLRS